MFLSEEQVARYQRDGFVILPDVLSADECDALNRELDEVIAEVRAEAAAAGKEPSEAVGHGVYVGLSVKRESFRAVARDSRFVDALESLWGPDIGFLSDKVVFKDAAIDFGSPWHQDWAYWKGSHKISIWVALDEATRDNGCLLVLPGTHTQVIEHDHVRDAATKNGFGNRIDLSAYGIDAEPVACELPRGSAVLFHDLALHASLPNTSGQPRRALIITYRDLSQPDEDYPYLPAAARVRGTPAETV